MKWVAAFLAGAILILLIGAFVLRLVSSNTPQAAPGQTTGEPIQNNTYSGGTTPPTSTGTNVPQPQGLTIATTDGAGVQVNDFLQAPATVQDPINKGQYYLGYHFNEGVADPTATDNPPYVIDYIQSTQFFNIGLYQEPIAQTRQQMEQYLSQQLGLDQASLCKLKYSVSVPARVNLYFAGQNLGFSFCPGSVQLPQ